MCEVETLASPAAGVCCGITSVCRIEPGSVSRVFSHAGCKCGAVGPGERFRESAAEELSEGQGSR
jgi:hypothetical protein